MGSSSQPSLIMLSPWPCLIHILRHGFRGTALFTAEEEAGRSWRYVLERFQADKERDAPIGRVGHEPVPLGQRGDEPGPGAAET